MTLVAPLTWMLPGRLKTLCGTVMRSRMAQSGMFVCVLSEALAKLRQRKGWPRFVFPVSSGGIILVRMYWSEPTEGRLIVGLQNEL